MVLTFALECLGWCPWGDIGSRGRDRNPCHSATSNTWGIHCLLDVAAWERGQLSAYHRPFWSRRWLANQDGTMNGWIEYLFENNICLLFIFLLFVFRTIYKFPNDHLLIFRLKSVLDSRFPWSLRLLADSERQQPPSTGATSSLLLSMLTNSFRAQNSVNLPPSWLGAFVSSIEFGFAILIRAESVSTIKTRFHCTSSYSSSSIEYWYTSQAAQPARATCYNKQDNKVEEGHTKLQEVSEANRSRISPILALNTFQ